MRLRATSINIVSQSTDVVDLVSIIYGITNSGSEFNLRSSGTVNYTVDWGDGSAEETSTSNNLAHTFATGDYTLRLNTDAAYSPFFNDVSDDIDQIVTTVISNNTNLGTSLQSAWSGANNMITFSCGVQPTFNVSNFDNAWLNCRRLTSFPSISTANATTFINAWKNNTSLIYFPQAVFDATGTLASNAFEGTFNNCALNAQSLGYILLSLDANGSSTIILDIDGGTNADIDTINDASIIAYKNLRSKNWNISHNGSYNDIIYTINSTTGGVFNLRSTGPVDYEVTWGDGSTDAVSPGIAIVGTNLAGGTLYFSTDNGSNWSDVGSVSSSSARVLYVDSNTRLAFQPVNTDYNGTISDLITFKAWDRSGGATNGAIADTNTSNTFSPSQIGDYDTPGYSKGVYVSADGNTAYMADHIKGLQILDISDPTNPTLTGTLDTSGIALDVVVSSDQNTAYVADSGSGLRIIDISNPASPTLTSTLDTFSAQAISLSSDENTIFIADSSHGVKIIDVSNSNNPTLIVTVEIGSSGRNARHLALSNDGNTMYTALGSQGMGIVDVTDPNNHSEISTFMPSGTSSVFGVAVSSDQNTAYIGTNIGLQIIDITNPSTPSHLSTLNVSGGNLLISDDDNTVFFLNNTLIRIIDVSNPNSPTETTTFSATGATRAVLSSDENTLYVADNNEGLKIYDVTPDASAFSSNTITSQIIVADDENGIQTGTGVITNTPSGVVGTLVSDLINSSFNTLPHTYAAGTYSLGVYSFTPYRPYFNNSGDEDQITSVEINSAANLGTDLSLAWKGANNMTSFVCPQSRTSNVTNFNSAWYGCSSLTSFPEIDTSNSTNLIGAWQNCSGLTSFQSINISSCTDLTNTWNNCSSLTLFPALSTAQCINFDSAWKSCSGLTEFPTISTSNGTNLTSTWEGCSNLTSFPDITTSSATTLIKTWSGCSSLSIFPTLNTSNATTVKQAWLDCSSLTTFPSLDVSSCTDFESAWQNCTSLSTFQADVFNSTGTLVSSAFSNSWENCALTSQSIENILKSLDVNGASNITLNISGGGNADASTWSSISRISYFNLDAKNWNISIKGTVDLADITYTITNTGSVFNLRSSGAVDYVIGWGDASPAESSTSNLTPHTYTSGSYSINIETNSAYSPYFNDVSADVDQITTVTIRSGATLSTSLQNAWRGANNMTDFVCDLTKTSAVTNFNYAWCNCSSLTSFPTIDTSNGLDFSYGWENCSGLTVFPTLTTTNGTNFAYAWYSCSALTAFPALEFDNATDFSYAWNNCTNLTTFEANVFDTTGTLAANAFAGAFTGCALTVQSIENILKSLDANGQSNIILDLNGGTNASAFIWSDDAVAAYNSLAAKGWDISYRGEFRTYELTYTINTTGTFVLGDAGTVNYDIDWGDGSAIETVTTNNKSHTYASSGTYTVKLDITGSYRPYYWVTSLQSLRSVSMSSGIVLDTELYRVFGYALYISKFTIPFSVTANVTNFNTSFNSIPGSQYNHALTSFPLIDTSSATDVGMMFYGQQQLTTLPEFDLSNVTNAASFARACSRLTSLPAFDLSSCTNLSQAFNNCVSLTSFPLITLTSACTNFSLAWAYCLGLTSFPEIDTSGGTDFSQTWRGVNQAAYPSHLVDFPELDFSSATTFNYCWAYSNALANFPPNRFDSTGTLAANAFEYAFFGCALTAQSIENILTSLDTNGQSYISLNLKGGTNADASTWSAAAITAHSNLVGKGWTIEQKGTVPTTEIIYTIVNVGTAFELRDSGTVNYVVDWGDGSTTETVTSNNKSHTYSAIGSYTVKVDTTGSYKPYFNNNSNGSQITMVDLDATVDLGTSLPSAWYGLSNMTSFTCPAAVTANVTDLSRAWYNCSRLSSFPQITLKSSGVSLAATWKNCTGLTTFPSLNTSGVTDFTHSFYNCSSLVEIPALDASSMTTFDQCFRDCTSLTTFPANVFDNITNNSINTSSGFQSAFYGCALTAQSIENILVSLDTSGKSNLNISFAGGTNADASTWSTAAITAHNNLIGKNWTIYQRGEVPSTKITNGLVLNLDAANDNSYSGSGTAWNDVSGNNNHATLTNGPTYATTNGGSIVFDGTNDYVAETSALSDSFLQGDWTISFWVKVDSVVTGGYIVQRNLLQHGANSTNAGLSLTQRSSSFALVPYSFSPLTGSTTVSNNTWYNVVFTHNSTSYGREVYLNGSLDGSNTGSAAYVGTGSNTAIGGMISLGNPLDGNIAIVLAYNRVLTATEILQNYNLTQGRFV